MPVLGNIITIQWEQMIVITCISTGFMGLLTSIWSDNEPKIQYKCT